MMIIIINHHIEKKKLQVFISLMNFAFRIVVNRKRKKLLSHINVCYILILSLKKFHISEKFNVKNNSFSFI